MISDQPTLHFRPLESYQQFVRNEKNRLPGVYVWGFCFREGAAASSAFMPYYVGKHEQSVQARIEQHVHGLRDGNHLLFRKDFFRRFSGQPMELAAERKAALANPDGPNIAYACKREVDGKLIVVPKSKLSAQEQGDLLQHINFYTDNLYATFVPIDGTVEPDPAVRKELIEYVERVVKHDLIGEKYVRGEIPKLPPESKFDISFAADSTLDHIFRGPRERCGINRDPRRS